MIGIIIVTVKPLSLPYHRRATVMRAVVIIVIPIIIAVAILIPVIIITSVLLKSVVVTVVSIIV